MYSLFIYWSFLFDSSLLKFDFQISSISDFLVKQSSFILEEFTVDHSSFEIVDDIE